MSNKKKILVNADLLDLQNAGIRNYLYQILRCANDASGHSYILIAGTYHKELSGHKQYVMGKWIRIPLWWIWKMCFVVPYIAHKEDVDVVWEPAHFGPIFIGSKKVRRVTSIHDLTPIHLPEFHTFRGSFLQKVFLKKILTKTDIILSNSKTTSQDLKNFLPKTQHAKISTLLLGKDPDMYVDLDGDIVEKYGLKKDFFLTVGTIEPRKNHATIIQAYERFREKEGTKNYSLVIVGSWGWKSKAIRAMMESSGYQSDIHVLGFVPQDDLRKLYSKARSSIYVSHYEGFGFPVLESLQCGCPCIASKNSSLLEVGGNCVEYLSENDPELLSSYMSRIMHFPEENVKAHLQRFDWKSHVEALEKIIS